MMSARDVSADKSNYFHCNTKKTNKQKKKQPMIYTDYILPIKFRLQLILCVKKIVMFTSLVMNIRRYVEKCNRTHRNESRLLQSLNRCFSLWSICHV